MLWSLLVYKIVYSVQCRKLWWYVLSILPLTCLIQVFNNLLRLSLAPFHSTGSLTYCSGFRDLFGIPFIHWATTLNIKKIYWIQFSRENVSLGLYYQPYWFLNTVGHYLRNALYSHIKQCCLSHILPLDLLLSQ